MTAPAGTRVRVVRLRGWALSVEPAQEPP